MNLKLRIAPFFFGLSLCMLLACGSDNEEKAKDDVLLAKVFNKTLFLSQLEGMVPTEIPREDSIMIVNTYVERWVRESLLMDEAEKNIPKDLNIDELVRDYRASLIRHNYEKLIVDTQLDSMINQEELRRYYDEHKDQYVLKSPIVRCHFIKIPQDLEQREEIEELWDKNEESSNLLLLDYCNNFASIYMLDDSTWYKTPDILGQLPKEKVKKGDIRSGKEMTFSHENFRYLLRINEVVAKNKTAPMSYVSEEASKVILHKRKLKLLDEKREEIYEQGMKMKKFEIYN